MPGEPNEFVALMQRVIQGDQQAFTELYNKYYKAIIMVVRYRLDRFPRLRALLDPTDFLQRTCRQSDGTQAMRSRPTGKEQPKCL